MHPTLISRTSLLASVDGAMNAVAVLGLGLTQQPLESISVFGFQAVCALAGAVVFTPTLASAAGEVNIYSYRQEFLIRPVCSARTIATAIR